jgi:hypothetical protein
VPNPGDFIDNPAAGQYNYCMIINFIAPGKEIKQYTWHEALSAAGATQTDHPMIQDQLLEDWIGNRRSRVIEFDVHSYSAELERAAADNIAIVIIKENPNDQS